MLSLSFIAFVLTIPALWLAATALKQLGQAHFIRAGFQSLSGLSIGLVALLCAAIGFNFLGYQRLTWEQPVAEIQVVQPLGERWLVRLITDNKTQEYTLEGDQWRLEAKVIKWQPWANVLGLNSQYRLERFGGRFQDHHKNSSTQYAVNAKAQDWEAKVPSALKPWVDTSFGNGVFMPLKLGAHYQVVITQSGLVARQQR